MHARNIFFAVVFILTHVSSLFAASNTPQEFPSGGKIDINLKTSFALFSMPYPGLNKLPDCLTLVTDGEVGSQINLAKLAALIAVEDGSGLIFQGSERVLHLLPAQLDGKPPQALHYVLKDVGTYLTGLRVRTLNGQPLRQVIDQVVKVQNKRPKFVGFVRTSSCP